MDNPAIQWERNLPNAGVSLPLQPPSDHARQRGGGILRCSSAAIGHVRLFRLPARVILAETDRVSDDAPLVLVREGGGRMGGEYGGYGGPGGCGLQKAVLL